MSVQTSNINDKWLDNVYENIKKIEEYQRLAREGCGSLLEYLQFSQKQREIVMGQLQYKNFKFILTEFVLLLADLTPIMEDAKEKTFQDTIDKINAISTNENLFLENRYDVNKNLVRSVPTPFFYSTLDVLHKLKIDLFKEIKHVLYIGKKPENE